jgi:hypothetical protein
MKEFNAIITWVTGIMQVVGKTQEPRTMSQAPNVLEKR